MRIAISGTFWAQPAVGSGQYLHHLVTSLAQIPSDHRYVLVIPRYTGVTKPHIPGWQVVMMPTPFDRRSENLAKVWFEQIALRQASRKLKVNLIHVPYFAAPVRSATPIVVTVHDLIPLLLPEYRGGRGIQTYMRLAAAGAKRAAAVIADSEHTRRDIIEHLHIPPERITVTHLAAAPVYGPRDEATIADTCARLRLRRPYIYYIGGFDARKNVRMVVQAYAEATRGWAERPALAIGGRVPTQASELFPDINSTILEAGAASDVALLGRVSDEDNAALMAGCAAFLCPSRYEGFGLTPLEAMQCGAPVIASRASSIPEVVTDAGILLAPDDLPGWTDALRRVLTDKAATDDLRARGRARAQAFRWEKTANETLAVYDQFSKHR
jgi:glycosyltransferase involved in cell wall biosynthesis